MASSVGIPVVETASSLLDPNGFCINKYTQSTISHSHFIFLLGVALILAALTLLPEYRLATEITLSRAQSWARGFGPITLSMASLLAVAAVFAWRYSVFALQICKWWGGFYALLISALAIYYFRYSMLIAAIYSLIFAVLLIWGMHRWFRKTGI